MGVELTILIAAGYNICLVSAKAGRSVCICHLCLLMYVPFFVFVRVIVCMGCVRACVLLSVSNCVCVQVEGECVAILLSQLLHIPSSPPLSPPFSFLSRLARPVCVWSGKPALPVVHANKFWYDPSQVPGNAQNARPIPWKAYWVITGGSSVGIAVVPWYPPLYEVWICWVAFVCIDYTLTVSSF